METPETPKTYKLETIPNDSIISIEMSGFFIKNIQAILVNIGEQMGKEALLKSIEKMKTTDAPGDLNEAILFVLLSIVNAAETAARAQNKTKIEEYTEDQLRKIIEDLDS